MVFFITLLKTLSISIDYRYVQGCFELRASKNLPRCIFNSKLVRFHSQVAEVLVEVQVFVVDGGEATLVGDVAVRGKHTTRMTDEK